MKVIYDDIVKTVKFSDIKVGQLFVYHDCNDKPNLFMKLEPVDNGHLVLNGIVVSTTVVIGHYKRFEDDLGVIPVAELRVKL